MNKKNNTIWTVVLLVLAFVGLSAYAMHKFSSSPAPAPIANTASSTPPLPPEVKNPVGNVSLVLGQKANFGSISITPLKVVEDSRCPIGVQCIQAGTVRVSLLIQTGSTSNTVQIALNRSAAAGGWKVLFIDANPDKVAGNTIDSKDYLFTFNVSESSS
ncbi:MAG: hypothetical protein JWL80_116 [Parcubacteria group bacterium]|nr:hypothetical protein [Parcubacteria group bacterium]